MNQLNSIESSVLLSHAPSCDGEDSTARLDAVCVCAQASALIGWLRPLLDQIEDGGRATLLVLRHLGFAADAEVQTRLSIGEHRHLEQQIQRMESLPVLSVAWVDGLCTGASFELAVATDLCFAALGASFHCPQVREGYLPGPSVNRLPGLIGARAARRLLLIGDTWNATHARAAGLIDDVLGPDQFDERVRELAARLPKDDGVALQMCRRLIREAHNTSYEAGVGHFMAAQTRCHDAVRAPSRVPAHSTGI